MPLERKNKQKRMLRKRNKQRSWLTRFIMREKKSSSSNSNKTKKNKIKSKVIKK